MGTKTNLIKALNVGDTAYMAHKTWGDEECSYSEMRVIRKNSVSLYLCYKTDKDCIVRCDKYGVVESIMLGLYRHILATKEDVKEYQETEEDRRVLREKLRYIELKIHELNKEEILQIYARLTGKK